MEKGVSLSNWIEAHRGELDALVFDVDGVLVIQGRALPGSVDLLHDLRQGRVLFSFLTNDPNLSRAEKASHLRKMGLAVHPEEIISSGNGLEEVVQENALGGELFFVMGDFGNPCYAAQAGLRVTRKIEDLPDCRGVIVNEENFDWKRTVNSVLNFFISKPEGVCIVPNPDEFFPLGSGQIEIAAGGIARFIKQVLGRYGVEVEPLYLGKPYNPIFQSNHRELERRRGQAVEPQRVLMVGDSLAADILGANNYGYRSALVLTGLTDRRTLQSSWIQPELVFEKL
ncbi:MAG: HAD-IIA family hydrolase [Desulfobacterales bacterium]|nr:MAG: HAD-IIA family hydrolase [Desulfobacterales bacterium]